MPQKIATLILFLFVSCIGCSSAPSRHAVPVTKTPHTVYLIYQKWHTSLAFDATQLGRYSPALAPYLQLDLQTERKKEAQARSLVRVGWGDGNYFTGKRKTWQSAASALFASSYSALQLLTYTPREFDRDIPHEQRLAFAISDADLRQLIQFIQASVLFETTDLLEATTNQASKPHPLAQQEKQAQQAPVTLHAYRENTGVFLQATGHYSVLNNCNTWSSKALQAAGLPVRRALTAKSLFSQAARISKGQKNREQVALTRKKYGGINVRAAAKHATP